MITRGRMMTRLGLLRNDALGDTLLALPVATAARRYDRAIQVELICAAPLAGLMAAHPDLDGVVADPGGGALALAALIRRRRYDALLVLRPSLRNALAAFLARVPARVGTAYRLYGPLFNVRWYGHRRVNQRHEVEYNQVLLEVLVGLELGHPQLYLPPPPPAEASAYRLLRESGWRPDQPLVAVHPGNRGSSLPWPIEHYTTLVERLREHHLQVAITGVEAERSLCEQVTRIEGVIDLVGRTTLEQAAWVYKWSDTMVGNSTGTLHLAAAVGTKVVGIYPAARINSPRRWGPWGPGHKVFCGPVDNCPECTGTACPVFNCLEMISPDQVLRVVLGMVTQSPQHSRRSAEKVPG